jgi:D-aminopeptidase
MPDVRARARDLGIHTGTMTPGPRNAITDVPGVGVGHRTIIEGDSVRTGVTVIMPRNDDDWNVPVFAAPHRLNGNGEMTGLEWIRESGMLMSPIAITNTHSVGAVHEGLVRWEVERRGRDVEAWALPVVAETWDGRLNDINGFHVRPEHVAEAIAAVSRGAVEEGNVGGGTGMVSFGFKAGIGTASRRVPARERSYTLGVLVQSNFGRRQRLTIDGVPVGRHLTHERVPLPQTDVPDPDEAGSIIVIAATDAPLLPHQCERVAQRITIGIGRVGGAGGHSSGDLFLCFATGNQALSLPTYETTAPPTTSIDMLSDDHIDGLFHAVIEATEEAILNAMLSAETMTGRNGVTAHALPHRELVEILAAGWFPLRDEDASG